MLAAASLMLLLLCGMDSAAASETSAPLVEADAAFSRGDYGAAIKLLTAVIDLDPKTPLLYTKRAAAYIVLRQQAQALRDLNKAIEVDSTFVQGYTHRGKLQRQMCNLAAAERDFNRVLDLKPGHKSAMKELENTKLVGQLLDQVVAYHAVGDIAAARASLEKLYDDAQDCMPAQLLEARLHMDQWQYEEVVAVTGRMLKSDPANLQALVLRGHAYFRLNDHDLAKRHYGEALKYDPDYTAASKGFKQVKDYDKKRQKGEAAAAAHDWAESETQYAAALHVDPEHRAGNAGLWLGLCMARFNLRRWDDAAEACTNTLILDPNRLDAKALIIRIYLAAERFQEAASKAREFFSHHQDNHELHRLLQEAEQRLKMALRKDHYKTLGVDKAASERDIKRAYRELAKRHHPDKVALDERPAAELKFREIAEAYEVLSDDERRTRFDNGEDDDQQRHRQQHPSHHQHGHQQHFHFQWG